jgi:hypothetical protein
VCQQIPGLDGDGGLSGVSEKIQKILSYGVSGARKEGDEEENNDEKDDGNGNEDEDAFWKYTLELALTSKDEHVSKAVYVLWRFNVCLPPQILLLLVTVIVQLVALNQSLEQLRPISCDIIVEEGRIIMFGLPK